jgi:hypothetical protein
MTNTFTTQQSTPLAKGRLSIWHGCSTPLGIVGGIF